MSHPLQPSRAPGFIGERCVHSHLPAASCTACVEVCPQQALALQDDALELNLEACDACGLCSAACPQEAIRLPVTAKSKLARDGEQAYVACERAGLGDRQDQVVPCLDAFSWADILRLHLSGIRALVAARGDCANCTRAKAPSIAQTVGHVNDLLASRNTAQLKLEILPSKTWQDRCANAAPVSPSPSRRAFFRQFVEPALAPPDTVAFLPPLPPLNEGASDTTKYPRVPSINADLCDGCDACIHLCPTHAIAQSESTDCPSYLIDASRCTGCNLCIDVCIPKAVAVRAWEPQRQHSVALERARCPACGVTYHSPTVRPDRYCRVCASVNHSRKLFQQQSD